MERAILNHLNLNVPSGDRVSEMLMAAPDNYAKVVEDLLENMNLSEFGEFVFELLGKVKVLSVEGQEPFKFTKYSEILEKQGSSLAAPMAKFEFITQNQLTKNTQFLEEELIPYLKSLYEANKPKFDQAIASNSGQDAEVKIMMMLQGQFDWFASQLKNKLATKKLKVIKTLRRNPEIGNLMAALTS